MQTIKDFRNEIAKLVSDFAEKNEIKNARIVIELETYTNVVHSAETKEIKTKIEFE